VKYTYIRRHQAEFKIRRMCRALGVSASGYYAWCARPESQRGRDNQRLLEHIRRVHHASRQAYGAVKTWRALNREGIVCGKHRVARLRREHHIEAKRRRRFKITTRSRHHHWLAPDQVQRCFHARHANQIWVGDVL